MENTESLPMRFHCPPCGLPRQERVNRLSGQISCWIHSDALSSLLFAWDSRIPSGLTLKEELAWLADFAGIWDYRRIQAAGGERFHLRNDEKLDTLEPFILDAAARLGLADISSPDARPDYLLILGGAGKSNLTRSGLAAGTASRYSVPLSRIAGLTTGRPIDPAEQDSVKEYAPHAHTEAECLFEGMELAFGTAVSLSPDPAGNRPACLCAPARDHSRRADSLDTYLYFLEQYSPLPGSRILLVTSAIYVPFQLMRFIPLALEHDLEADCIGVPAGRQSGTVFAAVHYLQEIKAALDAMNRLGQLYL